MIRTVLLATLTGFWFFPNSTVGVAGEGDVMMVRHQVDDYATWRAAFDEQDDVRNASGLTNVRVYQSADNPNEVVILLDAADLEQAKAFASSDELKARMMNAGVKGRPDILFLTIAP
jgi:hypothetical protein